MTVVDIHPEDLIDKLTVDGLTAPEQARLRAHLAQCASCRFEISVRGDLIADEPVRDARPQLTFAAPQAAPPPAALVLAAQQVAARTPITLRPRSRRRWALVLVAAALVLFAGVATAAVISGKVSRRLLPWLEQPKSAALTLTTMRSADSKHAGAQLSSRDGSAALAATGSSASLESDAAIRAADVESTPAAPPLSRDQSTEAKSAHRTLAPTPSSLSVTPGAPVAGASAAKALLEAPPVLTQPAPEPSAQVDTSARTEASALFAEANHARRDGNVERAIALYRALQSRFPSSAESELSRAVLAQVMLERGNAEGALAGFDRYLAADSPILNAEALVGRARALEQLGKLDQASAAWKEVEKRFPGSVHARLAAARLAALDTR